MLTKESHFDLNFLSNITSSIDEEDELGDSFFSPLKLVTYFGLVVFLFILANIINYVYQMKMQRLSQIIDESISGIGSTNGSKSQKEITLPPRYSQVFISNNKQTQSKVVDISVTNEQLPAYTAIVLNK